MNKKINSANGILQLTASTYQPHSIHTNQRDWAETNCYVDVWIELLHSLGYQPIAAMPFTLGIDFEGDQWTFFKFQLSDLYELYNIEVQELAIWKPLLEHIEQQISLSRPVLVELDSMFLPDTVGTAYQLAHVKTTVAINSIDIKAKKMGYFHAQSYYELEGDDFDHLFRLKDEYNKSHLEPYVEIVKQRTNRCTKKTKEHTVKKSINLLKQQLTKMPETNPFILFKQQLVEDLNWLKGKDLDLFHQYSFATLRQFGACFELASVYLTWLIKHGEDDLNLAAENYKKISEMAKIYQFQLARSVARGKTIETTVIDEMASLWEKTKKTLLDKYINK